MRCNMNHAVFCVTPSARAISWLLMPFFAFAINHTHGNHLSRPSAESSKMVPVLRVKVRFGCFVLHSQPFRPST